jgi:3'-5' exonuclease
MPFNTIMTFDIETIPDIETGKKIYGLSSMTDEMAAEFMFNKRKEENNGSEFLPHHLHRVIAISIALKTSQTFNVWSLGQLDSNEKDLLERFFNGIEKYIPTLVSWNGGSFDLPVLHYRALLHGIPSPRYWETGEKDPNFRWNNYLNRYHNRHTDVMDVLASYQARGHIKLDETAILLNLPGKMIIQGNEVWSQFLKGNLKDIRDYCEIDVLNTYLIFQRLQFIQGKIDESQYTAILDETRQFLATSNIPHFLNFLNAWPISYDQNKPNE